MVRNIGGCPSRETFETTHAYIEISLPDGSFVGCGIDLGASLAGADAIRQLCDDPVRVFCSDPLALLAIMYQLVRGEYCPLTDREAADSSRLLWDALGEGDKESDTSDE